MAKSRAVVRPVTGSVVLVTGAARGIGAALSRRLVGQGAQVLMLDVDVEPLEALASDLGEAALAVRADVTDLASLEAAVAQGVERFGGIDTVVANAGIASYGSVLSVEPAAFRRVVDINVTGVFHTVRAALPQVIERQGYVLVVSSLAAFTAAPGMAAYNASKAGAENFANALRLEVTHLGVAVGSAHMCWVDTPMVREARADLRSFDTMIDKLPPPLNRTTSVESCVDAFVTGIEKRNRRVYVPGWVGAIAKGRALMNSPLGERETLRSAAAMVQVMDDEVAALGRSTSARYSVD
ncbi:SDR family oxidoreductase [Nocardioides sp. HDW12B]|uniref:SDR family oxidoreductase n=1 Tax=Nocardioides sp. HDW12B TaxID=2714939 RepID=UPI001407FE80|nr:SDR family oxidoreductase [Nocardioides sp. HDW12B]QIK66791.1 SDR family oxidoreductase [Nocardioides sp. HDW12B]